MGGKVKIQSTRFGIGLVSLERNGRDSLGYVAA